MDNPQDSPRWGGYLKTGLGIVAVLAVLIGWDVLKEIPRYRWAGQVRAQYASEWTILGESKELMDITNPATWIEAWRPVRSLRFGRRIGELEGLLVVEGRTVINSQNDDDTWTDYYLVDCGKKLVVDLLAEKSLTALNDADPNTQLQIFRERLASGAFKWLPPSDISIRFDNLSVCSS